jgi:hypothetical protein
MMTKERATLIAQVMLESGAPMIEEFDSQDQHRHTQQKERAHAREQERGTTLRSSNQERHAIHELER